jgi:transcriptional antiterminator RfaH
MNGTNNGWHVLYVKSRHEKKVFEALKDLSVEVFLPLVKEHRKWKERKVIVQKPLFPSYVFVNIDSSLNFYKTLSVNGACMYIRFGMEYAKVSEEEINKIKFLIGKEYITNIETNVMLPKIGDLMEITHGPLCGLNCKVVKVNNEHKIIVHIESLQQNITATIPANYLFNKLTV